MDDVFAQIDELLKADPRAAARLADEVLADMEGELCLVARALCAWAGVRRVLAEWDDAESALRQAERLLKLADAGPAAWRDWHGRMTFLRRDQRRLDDALDHAEEALRCSYDLGDPGRLAQSLVDEAMVGWLIHRPTARDLAEKALPHLPPDDVAYRRSAVHLVLQCLCYDDAPDLDEIERRLNEARAFNDPPDSSPGVKLKWFEGLSELRHGRPATAVPLLRTAHDGLAALDAPVYAAVCALDLAEAHLANEDPASAADVAGLLFPVFKALRYERDATAALRLFCRAAEAGRLSLQVIREAREGLRASGLGD